MPGPWACGEQHTMSLPRYHSPLLFRWFWEFHLGSFCMGFSSSLTWEIIAASSNWSLRKGSLNSQVHLWLTRLRITKPKPAPQTPHQLLTQTLQMCHRPSISTWKPSTVPQMWSMYSLSQWTVSILDPVIPPPLPVLGHLTDPMAPTSYSFGICLLSATRCSVVHMQPTSSVLGNTLGSSSVYTHSPILLKRYLWSSLSTRKAILSFQRFPISLVTVVQCPTSLAQCFSTYLYKLPPLSIGFSLHLFNKYLWRTYYVLGSMHTVDNNKHDPSLTSFLKSSEE